MRSGGRGLGITSRLGPRTGVVEVDWNQVAKAIQALVDEFKPCGASALVSPAMTHAQDVEVRDADSGARHSVQVYAIPDRQVAGYSWGMHQRRFVGGVRDDSVVLYPNAGLCTSREDWKRALRPVLVHELAHAADPSIGRGRTARRPAPKGCAYVNDPRELRAFLTEVREELSTFAAIQNAEKYRKKGLLKQPSDLLKFSRTYQEMLAPCVTPKTRRKFAQMAARKWAELFGDG